jgi:hypothetical protein
VLMCVLGRCGEDCRSAMEGFGEVGLPSDVPLFRSTAGR